MKKWNQPELMDLSVCKTMTSKGECGKTLATNQKCPEFWTKDKPSYEASCGAILGPEQRCLRVDNADGGLPLS